jgi:hypothetical protein
MHDAGTAHPETGTGTAARGRGRGYVPWAITGNLVMTPGNLPWREGKLAYVGRIGRELSAEDGYQSC